MTKIIEEDKIAYQTWLVWLHSVLTNKTRKSDIYYESLDNNEFDLLNYLNEDIDCFKTIKLLSTSFNETVKTQMSNRMVLLNLMGMYPDVSKASMFISKDNRHYLITFTDGEWLRPRTLLNNLQTSYMASRDTKIKEWLEKEWFMNFIKELEDLNDKLIKVFLGESRYGRKSMAEYLTPIQPYFKAFRVFEGEYKSKLHEFFNIKRKTKKPYLDASYSNIHNLLAVLQHKAKGELLEIDFIVEEEKGVKQLPIRIGLVNNFPKIGITFITTGEGIETFEDMDVIRIPKIQRHLEELFKKGLP